VFDQVFENPTLVFRLGLRQQNAYKQLVDGITEPLRAYFSQGRSCPPQDIEDLVATTIANIYKFKFANYDPKRGKPAAIVSEIAKNVRTDYWRRRLLIEELPIDDFPNLMCNPHSLEASETEEDQRGQLLRLAMISLTRPERCILERRLRAEPLKQIAKACRISEEAARKRLSRVVKRLRLIITKLESTASQKT
jgi:RNA polymerase sigma factor (sigma-70 family)